MSYRRRHRWFRRMVLGLAFASIAFAGGASVAYAEVDETDGSRYVTAGGWSGQVDDETGIPLSAGIVGSDLEVIPYLSHGILTESDREVAAAEAIHDPYVTDVGSDLEVIPYLSHGILTESDRDWATVEAIHDPFLTDVFSRPGEAGIGPDGRSVEEWAQSVGAAEAIHDRPVATAEEQLTVVPYLSQGMLTEADRDAAAAEAIHDRFEATSSSRIPSGDEIAIANAVEERLLQEEPVSGPYSLSREQLGEAVKSARAQQQFVPGVTDFPKVKVDVPAVRPDDARNRFSHLDVAQQPELSSGGSSLEWNDGVTLGIGALVLAIGLGLALGYLRRPRLAGL